MKKAAVTDISSNLASKVICVVLEFTVAASNAGGFCRAHSILTTQFAQPRPFSLNFFIGNFSFSV